MLVFCRSPMTTFYQFFTSSKKALTEKLETPAVFCRKCVFHFRLAASTCSQTNLTVFIEFARHICTIIARLRNWWSPANLTPPRLSQITRIRSFGDFNVTAIVLTVQNLVLNSQRSIPPPKEKLYVLGDHGKMKHS